MDWAWLVWLGAALGLGVLEVLSLNLVLLMFGGGALAASAAAGVGLPPAVQVVVFAAVSVLLLVGVRPPLLRYSRRNLPLTSTGVAGLVGRDAQVIAAVTRDGGTVRLAGEVWSARTEDGEPALEPGSTVRVIRIDGATAIVVPPPALA